MEEEICGEFFTATVIEDSRPDNVRICSDFIVKSPCESLVAESVSRFLLTSVCPTKPEEEGCNWHDLLGFTPGVPFRVEDIDYASTLQSRQASLNSLAAYMISIERKYEY